MGGGQPGKAWPQAISPVGERGQVLRCEEASLSFHENKVL